jgi:hypothetical protein
MPLSKKFTCKGALWQVFYLSEAPFPPMTPYYPPLTHCIRVYSILIHTERGGGGGIANQSEGSKGATVYKAGQKYRHDWPVCKLL